ncbi:unnamed protein product [Polarella glacialis]|uniref:Uncharacterized protein n=1 Tax=Polarella glacialis TaxID=89957 RepID=A0A813G180_POLGL|nr:unnamed protein product [Polarella glacialis]
MQDSSRMAAQLGQSLHALPPGLLPVPAKAVQTRFLPAWHADRELTEAQHHILHGLRNSTSAAGAANRTNNVKLSKFRQFAANRTKNVTLSKVGQFAESRTSKSDLQRGMAASQLAAILESVSPRVAADELARLGEERAATILALMHHKHAEGILSEMGGQLAERIRSEMSTTGALSKSQLKLRLLMYGSLASLGVGLLSIAMCLAIYRRSGHLGIGPLKLRQNGVFWNDHLLCCGPKIEHDYRNLERGTDDDPGGTVTLLKAADEDVSRAPKDLEQDEATQRLLGRRQMILVALFLAYVAVSVGSPLMKAGTASCQNGFFWEDHLPFAFVFFATKIAELLIYATDPTIPGELTLWAFSWKFFPSLLAYADGYIDATSIVIAHSCDSPEAQAIAFWMMVSYVIGVVICQWMVVACLSLRDPSHACFMKVIHMDALASCITLPEDKRWVWITVNMTRTFFEDIPQCLLQILFLLHVSRNYFMMFSVGMSLMSSLKAFIDAITRKLEAVGVEEKLESERLGRELVPAAASGDHEKVTELLKAGASTRMDYANSGGISPLMLAIAAKDQQVATLLRAAGAEEPVMTVTHDSIAMACADRDLADVVRHIAAGADVNTRLKRGEGVVGSSSGTLLHACCALHRRPGSYEFTVLLLRRRADASIGDGEGDTPLAHAKYHGATQLFELLEGNGAILAGPFYR